MVRAKHIPMLLRSEPIRGDGFYKYVGSGLFSAA